MYYRSQQSRHSAATCALYHPMNLRSHERTNHSEMQRNAKARKRGFTARNAGKHGSAFTGNPAPRQTGSTCCEGGEHAGSTLEKLRGREHPHTRQEISPNRTGGPIVSYPRRRTSGARSGRPPPDRKRRPRAGAAAWLRTQRKEATAGSKQSIGFDCESRQAPRYHHNRQSSQRRMPFGYE
jgi:hypothetical protein